MGVSGFKVDVSDGYLSDPVQTTPGSKFAGTNISRAQFTEYYHSAIVDWVRAHTTNEGITIGRPYSWQGELAPPLHGQAASLCRFQN